MLTDGLQPVLDDDSPEALSVAGRPVGEKARRILKAEVNLLRLPLFALQTKGLRTLDGFECRGSVTRDSQSANYLWRVTRHATRPFPGPLARATHLAFLDILTERGLPLVNPVTWGWRDLCRRIGISYSGRAVRHLKEAIRATHGLLIESSGAIYSKTAGKLISLTEDDRSLYSRVRFFAKRGADGGMAEENGVWLAQWYLDSLNSLYTAPLDHELWRFLDRQSPIASRLYEYLLPAFYGPAPALRINYPNLAQSLPVRVERYFSDAKKQFGSALRLLRQSHVVSRVDWSPRKASVAQLLLYRGARLERHTAVNELVLIADPADSHVELRELRSPSVPEARLVANFYRLWQDNLLHRPTAKELGQAKAIIAQHGIAEARNLLPRVIRLLKQHWPDAKTFGAAISYFPQAAAEVERNNREAQRHQTDQIHMRQIAQQDQQNRLARQQFAATWQPVWETLSTVRREEIKAAVMTAQPWLSHMPGVLAHACLVELARQVSASQTPKRPGASDVQASGQPAANGAQE